MKAPPSYLPHLAETAQHARLPYRGDVGAAFDNVVLTRRTTRAFQPHPVGREIVTEILEVAARAPYLVLWIRRRIPSAVLCRVA